MKPDRIKLINDLSWYDLETSTIRVWEKIQIRLTHTEILNKYKYFAN
jgi:hypothetical protein